MAIKRVIDERGVQRIVLNPKWSVSKSVCLNCWTVLDNITAFCRHCGHSATHFSTDAPVGSCLNHPAQRTTCVCNLCLRSFCSQCVDIKIGGILMPGTKIFKCHLCVDQIEHIKNKAEVIKDNPKVLFWLMKIQMR